MTTESTFHLLVRGTPVPVSEDVYRAYYKCYEHARYLDHLAARYHTSLEYLEEANVPLWENQWQPSEDALERDILRRTLDAAMKTLPPALREGLWDYALGNATDRDLAARWHVSKSTACRRRQKACAHLRQYLRAHGITR